MHQTNDPTINNNTPAATILQEREDQDGFPSRHTIAGKIPRSGTVPEDNVGALRGWAATHSLPFVCSAFRQAASGPIASPLKFALKRNGLFCKCAERRVHRPNFQILPPTPQEILEQGAFAVRHSRRQLHSSVAISGRGPRIHELPIVTFFPCLSKPSGDRALY